MSVRSERTTQLREREPRAKACSGPSRMADEVPPYDEVPLADMEYDEDEEMYYYKCPCGDLFEISQARTLSPAVNTHQRSAPAVCRRAATRRLPPRRRNLMRASSSPAKSQRGRRTGTVVHLLVVLATSRRPSRRSLSERRSRSRSRERLRYERRSR